MDYFKKQLFICLSWMAIYFSPTIEFLLLAGFFVAMDTTTGVMAVIKSGEEFTSKKFRAVIPKYIVYGCGVLVAHVLQQQFFPDFPALKIITGLIAYSELISIDENINKITGVSLFKFFIKKMKK